MEKRAKWPDFRIALKRFIEDICARLPRIGIAVRRWVRIIHEEGGWSFPEEERPDYSGTSFLLMRKFHENPPDTLLQVLDIARRIP